MTTSLTSDPEAPDVLDQCGAGQPGNAGQRLQPDEAPGHGVGNQVVPRLAGGEAEGGPREQASASGTDAAEVNPDDRAREALVGDQQVGTAAQPAPAASRSGSVAVSSGCGVAVDIRAAGPPTRSVVYAASWTEAAVQGARTCIPRAAGVRGISPFRESGRSRGRGGRGYLPRGPRRRAFTPSGGLDAQHGDAARLRRLTVAVKVTSAPSASSRAATGRGNRARVGHDPGRVAEPVGHSRRAWPSVSVPWAITPGRRERQ